VSSTRLSAELFSRLLAWLEENGLPAAALAEATFYSDSANDLPLLRAVGRAVAVDPDDALRREAETQGWTVLALPRRGAAA
jgi:phosphoserine phosphatase